MGEEFYQAVVIGIFISAAITFTALFFLSAPYGRHGRKGCGLVLDPRWAWLIMESPSFLIMAAMAIFGHRISGAEAIGVRGFPLFFFGLWELHYGYRCFMYPFRIRRTEKNPFPVVLMAMAVFYNSANAYVNGFWLFASGRHYESSWISDPRFAAGIVLFFTGALTHLKSDAILRGLRRPGENGYKIPFDGLFRYVSSPNYLGEIVEWYGFAIATWSLAGLSFAVFTTANLLPRALSNHRWYHETFPEYPKDRKALIPFLL